MLHLFWKFEILEKYRSSESIRYSYFFNDAASLDNCRKYTKYRMWQKRNELENS